MSTQPLAMKVLMTPIPVCSTNRRNCLVALRRMQPLPARMIGRFALRMALKWLNRRSQRRSFSWAGFSTYLKHYPLPTPRIVHNLYTLSPVT